jgi:predicted transcriptional regulator
MDDDRMITDENQIQLSELSEKNGVSEKSEMKLRFNTVKLEALVVLKELEKCNYQIMAEKLSISQKVLEYNLRILEEWGFIKYLAENGKFYGNNYKNHKTISLSESGAIFLEQLTNLFDLKAFMEKKQKEPTSISEFNEMLILAMLKKDSEKRIWTLREIVEQIPLSMIYPDRYLNRLAKKGEVIKARNSNSRIYYLADKLIAKPAICAKCGKAIVGKAPILNNIYFPESIFCSKECKNDGARLTNTDLDQIIMNNQNLDSNKNLI